MTIAAIIALFLFYSSSPAWAHAFGSSTSSLVQPTRRSSSCYAVATHHRSGSVMSLPSSLVLLRGGEQDRVAEVDDESHNTNDSVDAELHYFDSNSMDDEIRTLMSVAVLTPLSSIGSFYAQQLRTRPIQTKSVTAGIIFGLSDYFAQTIERGKDDDDADAGKSKKEIVQSRILTSFLVGLCIFGPAANKWYSTMFQIWPSTALLPTLIKAFLGQLLFGPAFTW
jgi:hypothetical protein